MDRQKTPTMSVKSTKCWGLWRLSSTRKDVLPRQSDDHCALACPLQGGSGSPQWWQCTLGAWCFLLEWEMNSWKKSERVRISWNLAEASRQCCLSSASLPGFQVAWWSIWLESLGFESQLDPGFFRGLFLIYSTKTSSPMSAYTVTCSKKHQASEFHYGY